MRVDDPRHGTIAGYLAHRRAGTTRCQPCLDAKMRYEKQRTITGRPLKVPVLGTQRRIQALRALGYSLRDIAQACGHRDKSALNYPLEQQPDGTTTRATAARVAAAYERLSMTIPTGPKANRMRILAARRGWVPPLAWDDIDHDTHPHPDIPHRQRADTHVDPVVIDRILTGDLVPATTAERRAIVAAWPSTGRSYADLARLTGWKVERYHHPQREDHAA